MWQPCPLSQRVPEVRGIERLALVVPVVETVRWYPERPAGVGVLSGPEGQIQAGDGCDVCE